MTDNPIHALTEMGEVGDGAELLLFENSPYGYVDAIVQQDGRTVYFYLNPRPVATNTSGQPSHTNPALKTQACWVRNLQPGPYVLNEDEIRSGVSPLLPRTHLVNPAPGRLPASDDLKIVWFEEGNGAALIDTSPPQASGESPAERVLAVIPPWSGIDGFHGYAAECASESPLCWPLPKHPLLQQRIDRAAEFWASFGQSPDPFGPLQVEILDRYEQHFLKPDNTSQTSQEAPADNSSELNVEGNRANNREYFSIDGGKFPPRGLVHFHSPHRHVLATVAMSMCPQPMVELDTDTPQEFRRIELAVELPATATENQIETAKKELSRLAGYPWRNFRWLGHGHSCQFSGVFTGADSVNLVHDREHHAPSPIRLNSFRGDPLNLLWLVPRL